MIFGGTSAKRIHVYYRKWMETLIDITDPFALWVESLVFLCCLVPEL